MDIKRGHQKHNGDREAKIINEIVSCINDNDLQPGDILFSELQLAEKLGLSRASVRECISRLNNIGLLHSVQGKGIILNEITVDTFFRQFRGSAINLFLKLSPDDIRNIKELRELIETYAVEQYLSSTEQTSELEEMSELLDKMKQYCVVGNYIQYMKVDLLFHKALVRLAKNNFLYNIYSTIRVPTLREVEALFSKDNLSTIQIFHEQIYEGLKQKDPDVVNIIKVHLEYLVKRKN